MPSQWQTFPIEFRGGLISNMNPLQQGINMVGSATFLQNFEPSKEGGYKKVLGYEKFVAGSVPGTGPMLGVKVVNSSDVIAVRRNASDVSQYYINSGATWSSIGSAALLGNRVKAVDFNFDSNHKILFVDGVNSPAVFNDTTNVLSFPSLPADLTGSEHVALYKNAIFLGKGANLHFSAPYTETDFSAASGGGVINVGHSITGLIVFRDQLIVFSRNKIQRLLGSSLADFQLVPIADDIGCLHGETIQEVGGDVMFMAADGLRLLGATERIGDFGLEVASAPINKDALSFINSTQTFSSLVLREKAQYRVFAYTESVGTDVAKGLMGTKFSDQGAASINWATLSGFKIYVADGRYVPGQELTVFANADGYVYRLETGSSRDGRIIEAIYKSPFMPINDPQIRKTFYKLSLYVETQGTFAIDVNFDFDLFKTDNYTGGLANTIRLSSESDGVFIFGSPSTVFGSAIFGAPLDNVYNTNVIGSGKTVSLRIEDKTTNPSFSLDTAVLEFRTNERK
jgi:hypothetical protein